MPDTLLDAEDTVGTRQMLLLLLEFIFYCAMWANTKILIYHFRWNCMREIRVREWAVSRVNPFRRGEVRKRPLCR